MEIVPEEQVVPVEVAERVEVMAEMDKIIMVVIQDMVVLDKDIQLENLVKQQDFYMLEVEVVVIVELEVPEEADMVVKVWAEVEVKVQEVEEELMQQVVLV